MQNEHPRSGERMVVTSALPYANGDIHLGHLVETVQTDIFVRYNRLRGKRVVYVCADDTHGTPIELNAIKQGITSEQLIDRTWHRHVRDYKDYNISFDIFYTTNSPENKHYAELIYSRLREKGLIVEKKLEQYFCEHDKRFLPDRFITGTCPRCGSVDQYGDVCEVCGATYSPAELTDPKCILCKNRPELRVSNHLFVDLARRTEFLREYTQNSEVLQEDMKNFVLRWIDEGLREWCISRDGPYFGFPIPGTENKYFYVWLDAPIGYLSSTDKWCTDNGENIDDYWGKDAPGELVHFIGKDIVYFHALFWPVMLKEADFKLPRRIFVHGFLTVEGEKMSKTRGTFILARDFADKVSHPAAPEYLRFYYGAKLANTTADIDLNIGEFVNRVNTTLVNNIGNLHHRTSVFIERSFGGEIPDASWDPEIAAQVETVAAQLAGHFERAEFKSVIEKVHQLGSVGNKYYQDTKPWELNRSNPREAAAVMVTCINLVKALAVFLKPFVPNMVEKIEKQLGLSLSWDDYRFSLRNMKMGTTEKLVRPLETKQFDALHVGGGEAGAGKEESQEGLIDIDQFAAVDLRVGTIKQADRVPKSDKLLKLQLDTGSGTRQIIAGIGKYYAPEELVGRSVVFVANLKPAKLMGEKSEGMVLAAQKGKKLTLLRPDDQIGPGARIS